MFSENGVLVDFEEISKLLVKADVFVVGFATLVVRLRGHDPYDPDDGAVV